MTLPLGEGEDVTPVPLPQDHRALGTLHHQHGHNNHSTDPHPPNTGHTVGILDITTTVTIIMPPLLSPMTHTPLVIDRLKPMHSCIEAAGLMRGGYNNKIRLRILKK